MTGAATIRTLRLATFAWLAVGNYVAAEQPSLQLLESLRQRGYGDMAVAYIEQLSERSDTLPAVREVLDLELSSSYRAWAQQTQNTELSEQRMAESRRLFDKFAKDHPRHVAVPFALLDWGDSAFRRGQRILSRVESIQDARLRAKTFADARAAFKEARPQFEQAAERFKQQAPAPSSDTSSPTKEDESPDDSVKIDQAQIQAQVGLMEAKLKLAGVDFYIAKTYPNESSPERSSALKTAEKGFEWVSQRCRDSEVGLRAQLWQAKVSEELGKLTEAMELYNEVLAAEPTGNDLSSEQGKGLSPEGMAFFAEAALWRLKLVQKQNGPEQTGTDAGEWLRTHQSWKGTAPYQGIALEAAKAVLWRIGKEPARKEKLLQEAKVLLTDISKVPSEYKDDAIKLLRENLSPNGKASFDEQLTLGDAAAEAGRWPDAVAAYSVVAESAQQAVIEGFMP